MKTSIPAALGNINGVSVALAYTVVNSALAVLIAFSLRLSPAETGAILAFVNNAGVLIAYIVHNSAKRSQTVIPAGPVDQSKSG